MVRVFNNQPIGSASKPNVVSLPAGLPVQNALTVYLLIHQYIYNWMKVLKWINRMHPSNKQKSRSWVVCGTFVWALIFAKILLSVCNMEQSHGLGSIVLLLLFYTIKCVGYVLLFSSIRPFLRYFFSLRSLPFFSSCSWATYSIIKHFFYSGED